MTFDYLVRGIAAGLCSAALLFVGAGCAQEAATDSASFDDDGGIVISSVNGTMEFYGPQGGPFPVGTRTYRLRNNGTEQVVWRMDADEAWMGAVPNAGILTPGQESLVTIEIDQTLAGTLPQGDYPSEIVLRTVSDPLGEVFMGYILHVLPPGGSALRLQPASGLVIDTDLQQPTNQVDGEITVENTGSMSFMWSATASEPWLSLEFPAETHFAPGQTDTLQVFVDQAALSALGFGTYQASVDVYDVVDPGIRLTLPLTVHLNQTQNNRVTAGLQAEYRFNEGAGNIIHDASGVVPPMDLTIADTNAVTWQPNGIRIDSPTLISTPGAATRLVNQIRQTGQVTVEAWIRPDNINQDGPARLIGISNGPNLRNFTLAQGLWGGQPSNTFNMRYRTTGTDMDGMPMLTTAPGGANLGLQHLVYVRGTDGNERLYVNGNVVSQQYKGGDLSNWDSSFRLAIANEIGAARPWLGELFLMAVYDRALSDSEITQNLTAGSGASNAGHLDVQPGDHVYLTAIQGQGPVTQPTDFVVGNVGGEPLDWRVTLDQNWLGIPVSQSSLQPGESTVLPVNLDGTQIASLPIGSYTANAVFRNDTTGYGSSLTRIHLTVSDPGAPGTGNRPGPGNTGPSNPSILQTVGGMTITQDGTVVENVRIFGAVDIQANNVTLRNFVIDAGNQPYAIRCNNGNQGLLIEDGELYNVSSAHIYGGGFSAYRLNLHDSGGDGIKTTSNALVQDCWIHHLGTAPGAHADCNQTRGGSNLVFRSNFFDLPIDIGAPYKQNACLIIQTGTGPVDNVLIEDNWIEGGNFSVYTVNKWTPGSGLPNYGPPTNVRIFNNRFGRAYRFGTLRQDGNPIISGNRWDDNDQLMDINNQ